MAQSQHDALYSLGWDGKTKTTDPLQLPTVQLEADGDDPDAIERSWETLAEHTDRVVTELSSLLDSIDMPDAAWTEALELAARWHDAGKAHQVFQESLLEKPPEAATGRIWAKAKSMARYKRPGFRHELASALAMLDQGLPRSSNRGPIEATHHLKRRQIPDRGLRGHRTAAPLKPLHGRCTGRRAWTGGAFSAVGNYLSQGHDPSCPFISRKMLIPFRPRLHHGCVRQKVPLSSS